jgi:hypothetical protein
MGVIQALAGGDFESKKIKFRRTTKAEWDDPVMKKVRVECAKHRWMGGRKAPMTINYPDGRTEVVK